jgi:hypothetical protein
VWVVHCIVKQHENKIKIKRNRQYSVWVARRVTLDAESNINIKEIEILLKRNWSFMYHIFIKEIERNILNLDSIFF